MGSVYESLKGVVRLQRSKSDPIALAEIKHTHTSSLGEELNEIVQRINGLRAAVKYREEEIKKETQEVIRTLSEDFAMLETKLKDSEETVRRKESVSQKMEEKLNAEIQTLQNQLNTEKDTLQSRDREIHDLNSKVNLQVKQITELETAINKAKAETATEADRNAKLTEDFNTQIAALQTEIRHMKEIVRDKEAAITVLEQKLAAKIQEFENQLRAKETILVSKDGEINDLKAKLQVLTGKIQEMSSFLKQTEALVIVEGKNSSTLAASEPLNGTKDKSVDSSFKDTAPAATSNNPTNPSRQTVAPDFFDLMSQELTMILGPQAGIIVGEHVAALGESTQKFPKARLAELLEILSQEIVNEPLRISFRKWFVKQHV